MASQSSRGETEKSLVKVAVRLHSGEERRLGSLCLPGAIPGESQNQGLDVFPWLMGSKSISSRAGVGSLRGQSVALAVNPGDDTCAHLDTPQVGTVQLMLFR